ncbi:tyrosine-type recombinase/integrase [Lampropedia aestuarii]|uniref:tyrosine-type recombinase/integrase n=1 Tax=Lampropedia aestuarii TaxID=2562762 RepID=UPI0024685146|nr:site-specific integrase [Lampropedia aestuarii]MDH5859258.1 tyrosine-type recombinase/integrase [Lampropedia aestuarii]
MPKKAKELSIRAVQQLKDDGRHAVGGVDGLHLRISNGSKAWVLRMLVGEKRRDLGLGPFPQIGLAEARDLAREMRKSTQAGNMPITPRRQAKEQLIAQQSASKTFKECAEALMASKSNEWKNAKHQQQWANTLSTYAYPTIGSMAVDQIELQHILSCLEPIWLTKTETASRLRGRIESVLDYATVRKYRSGENPARWKGHLDSILPKPSKVQQVEHHPAMPINDVPAFIQAVSQKKGMSAQAMIFLILTASRSGEARGARWEEINMEQKVWIIPAGRTKTSTEHRVPLSNQAIALLVGLPRIERSPLVFPSPNGLELSDMALNQMMRKMQLKYVPHGFRSTFRDWAAERTNHPRELAEQALGHAIANKVEAAYRRGDALEKRRVMMQEWSDQCFSSMN